MKKIIIGMLVSFLFIMETKAQVYLTDISGTVIKERSVNDLGGSPFFNDQFLKGSIKLEDNSVFQGIYLRYDQEADQLVYRKPNSSVSMMPNSKVVAFNMELPSSEVVSFKNVAKGEESSFYQVIADGKFSLLKKTKKKIVEKIEYNSTSKSKSLITQTNYFILKPDGTLESVRADKKSILKALGDADGKLSNYVAQEKINFRNEADLSRLISFQNSQN